MLVVFVRMGFAQVVDANLKLDHTKVDDVTLVNVVAPVTTALDVVVHVIRSSRIDEVFEVVIETDLLTILAVAGSDADC